VLNAFYCDADPLMATVHTAAVHSIVIILLTDGGGGEGNGKRPTDEKSKRRH